VQFQHELETLRLRHEEVVFDRQLGIIRIDDRVVALLEDWTD
jgi:hypothetical protein